MFEAFKEIKREELRRKIRQAFQPTYGIFAEKFPIVHALFKMDELPLPFRLAVFNAYWNELTSIQVALFEKFGVDKYQKYLYSDYR